MSDFRREKKKTALDNPKLSLSVPCPVKDVKARSSMKFDLVGNNPRITVYTNDPSDKDNNFGRIQAKLDIVVFGTFLSYLQASIDATEKVTYCIENKNYTWFKKQRSETPVVESKLWVGRDENGVVWVCVEDVVTKNRPRIKFPFTLPYFHALLKNGEPMTEAEVSRGVASAFVHALRDAMHQLLVDNYEHVDPKSREKNGGGNDRGNQSRTSSNNSNDKDTDDFDDDIPF